MKAATVYYMTWDLAPVASSDGTADRQDVKPVEVFIYDNGTLVADDAPQTTITLQPAANPLEIQTTNDGQDKFQQIRSKQAKIRFISDRSQGLSITTFSDAYDNQFYIEAYVDSQTLFLGYLMLPDAQMPFQPDPQTVELTASDHLPLLKDIALVDTAGDNPTGKYRIAEYLSFCLKQTGLTLPINVINNLRTGSGVKTTSSTVIFAASDDSITVTFYIGFFYVGQQITITGSVSNNITTTVTEIVSSTKIKVADPLTDETTTIYSVTFTDTASGFHFYDGIELDAKTFEAEIGVSEDCYTVLGKIFGDDSAIFQYKGEWWVIRIDEYDDNPLYKAKFDADGVLTDDPAEIDLDYSIGFDQNVIFAAADQLQKSERPNKFIKETFRYNNPIEIVCNIDFSRGTGVDPTPSNPSESIDYTLDCWDFLREGTTPAGLDSPPSVGSLGVLRKVFEYGYEKERYLVTKSAAGFRHYFKGSAIEVQTGDKIEIGVDFRLATSETFTNINPVHVRLIGDDGFVYDWNYDQPTNVSFWHQKTTADTVFDDEFRVDWSGADTTQWYNVTAISEKIPVSGTIIIRLVNGIDTSLYLWFSNLTVDYQPLINGSYQKYTGHYNKVSRSEVGYAAKRENEIYLGDAPTKVTKGAMFLPSGALATLFYPAAKYGITGQPSDTQTQPFGWHQAMAVWNQNRGATRIFTGSVQGLGDNWPDLLHRITLSDDSPDTTGRYFLLISFQQDWRTSSWEATFIECYNSDVGRIYTDTHEFKYLTQ